MPAIEAALSAEPTAYHSRAKERESTGLSLLGRVDDAALEEVASSSSAGIPLVLLGAGVVAVVALAVLHLIHDDATFEAGVASSSSAATALDNHAQRLFVGAADDLDAELLVLVARFI